MNCCFKIEYGWLFGEIGWVGVNFKMLFFRCLIFQGGFQYCGLNLEKFENQGFFFSDLWVEVFIGGISENLQVGF